MTAMFEIKHFVDYLAQLQTPNEMSINMYQGDTRGAKGRLSNLMFYLEKMQKINPSVLFIGEAPGRRGCFLSGVPFTDEYTLVNNAFFGDCNSSIKELMDLDESIKPQRESTASIVWSCLDRIPMSEIPLMWNIFPFHPSIVSSECRFADDRPNRTPTLAECEFGMQILNMLLDCFDIQKIYAIGRSSENMMKRNYKNVDYIRHPSMGGSSRFIDGFNKVFENSLLK